MSDQDSSRETTAVLVEIHTMFMASNQAEAEALLDQVMDAELSIVCPSDESRLAVCSHCDGTLVNPLEEDYAGAGAATGDPWAPGRPCAMCADTKHPGQEMACAREHVGGATIHTDGNWKTTEDRRIEELLLQLLTALDQGDASSARQEILERLTELGVSHDVATQ